MSTGHPPSCPECVPCQGADCSEAAYCTSEPGPREPLCLACQTEAMDGPGWQEADPLFVPPVESDAAYRARTRLAGFDSTTNTYLHGREAEETDAVLARLLDVDGALTHLNEQAEATRKSKP